MASPSLPVVVHAPLAAGPKVKVKTTWPKIPPNGDRAPIRTERLLLRPFTVADAEEIHEMRKQPEVMQWTAVGLVDKDIDATNLFVRRFLYPNDLETYNFAIVYLGDAAEGEDAKGVVIGSAGAHRVRPDQGWPEIGYLFRKEYWGKGLATEFLRAFIKAWWALPRIEVEIEVDAASLKGNGEKTDGGVIEAPENLTALINAVNAASRNVLEKAGFREYKRWTDRDSRAGYEGLDVELVAFRLEAPKAE